MGKATSYYDIITIGRAGVQAAAHISCTGHLAINQENLYWQDNCRFGQQYIQSGLNIT